MSFSAIDAISPAIEHTKRQLFKPFRLGQWTRLAVVGLLAGELGGFNGCNSRSFRPPGAAHPHFPGLGEINLALLAALIGVIVVAALVFGLLLMYVSSVMRFILFDSVLARQCHIRMGWGRRQGPGWRYFLWKLAYLVFTCAGFLVLLGIPAAFAFSAGWFTAPKEHVFPLVVSAIILFFILVAFIIAIGIIFVFTKDFVVPQMALENIGAFEGWRRLWPMIEAEKAAYAGYIVMKILMAIGAGILIGIAAIVLGLFIAIPTAGLSIIAILTGKSAGLTWNAYTITLAIVVGSFLFAGFLYLISLISVPIIVFFPAYSIYFFAARYRPLGAGLYPPAPAAPMPPPTPPPLPPSPQPAG